MKHPLLLPLLIYQARLMLNNIYVDPSQLLRDSILQNVKFALREDLGHEMTSNENMDGDITAQLIDEQEQAEAIIISRESAILCGVDWVLEVFRQLNEVNGTDVSIEWNGRDGDKLKPNQTIATLKGNARVLLTGERSALNFLQTLSATATVANEYAQLVSDSPLKILDTRKTIPALRLGQKYAVACGGCDNHRKGLYDSYLIKENHIAAYGSIRKVIARARLLQPDKRLEIEVENEKQLIEALSSKADIIMLDNFDNEGIIRAVTLRNRHNTEAKLEVSGNIDKQRIVEIKHLGADYVSVGALTKHCKAIDLSMRFV